MNAIRPRRRAAAPPGQNLSTPDYVSQYVQQPLQWHYTAGQRADERDTVAAFPGVLDINDVHGSDGTYLPAPGMVGEGVYASRIPANALPMGNNVSSNILRMDLEPGDWDVWGCFIVELRNLPTSVSHWMASVTPMSNFQVFYPDQTTATASGGNTIPLNAVPMVANMGPVIITTTIPLTYYLNGFVNWTGGTCFAYGNMFARRRR